MTVREAGKIVAQGKDGDVVRVNGAMVFLQCHELYKPLVRIFEKISEDDTLGGAVLAGMADAALAHYRTHILGEEK